MEYMVGEYDTLNIDDGLYDGRRMSCLSIESTDGNDADVELSDYEKGPELEEEEEEDDDDDDEDDDDEIDKKDAHALVGASVSLPGTPERWRRRGAGASQPIWVKDYASVVDVDGDVDVDVVRGAKGRERWLDRAWELRKCQVRAREAVMERPLSMRMDMDEVKACLDLGLGLPCDWTVVEIPSSSSGSGSNSPVAISPGDDPKDVKARLRSWAQAVALASANRLTC